MTSVSAIDIAATQRAGNLGADRGARPAAARRWWSPPRTRRQGREPARDVERRRRGRHPGRRGQAGRQAARQGLAARPISSITSARVDNQFDYQWEERWIRDAGYMQIVPPAIGAVWRPPRSQPADVTHFCMPATLAARRQRASPRRPASPTRRCATTARQLRRHRRRASARAAGGGAREGQARRQDPGGRLRPGLRRAAVRGHDRDRQAGPRASASTGHLARRKEETNYGQASSPSTT